MFFFEGMHILRFIFLTAALPLGICAAETEKEEKLCPEGKPHYRANIRHIESGGIGYEDGYTTFETFFASDPSQWRITPFLDARGHIFDDGKWAANAGVGLRALFGNRVYGVNAYYDYRNTKHFHSNQIGVGLETLGELFDFRINGYLPVGAKISSPYSSRFGGFSGHYMLLSQKFRSAMKGADAELGFHFGKSDSFDFYAAAGPYYFIGEIDPATWGGKARVSATFKDLLNLEISDSYDRTFHNKFQGQIGLSFSFGPKSKVKEQGRTCKVANILNNRILQPVERQEIIVINKPRKTAVAIDPTTGLPYFFVFVNNMSSSNGTYESPYPTLTQAQDNSSPNDIIYVFPGDGTTTGMDVGIFLKANQKFWGSGVTHSIQTSFGTISIPAQTSASPTITNTDADTEGNAVTLATHNAISGFTIASALHDAIYGTDLQGLEVSFCTIETNTTYAIEASFSGDASISLTNNQILNNANGVRLTLNGTSTVACSNNTFEGQTSVSSIPLEIVATNNTFTTRIENNLFNNNTTGSVRFALVNVANADIILNNNTITNNGTGALTSLASSLSIVPSGTINYCSIALRNNAFSENTSNAVYLHTDGTFTTLEMTAIQNTISSHGGSGLVLSTPVDALTLLLTDNTITAGGDNGIAVIAPALSSTGNITINNNTITDATNFANGIAVNQNFSDLTLTILNNEIRRCNGTGILSYSPAGIDSLTMNISGNTISDCENEGANAASGIDIEQYVALAGTIANNTLSGNAGDAVAISSTLMDLPTACLTLTGNDSSSDYRLTNPDGGVFNLSPCNVNAVNVGTINLVGTIDLVQSCPDGTPCPP